MESARASRLDQVLSLHHDDFKEWQIKRAAEIMRTAPPETTPADMITRLMTMVPMKQGDVFTFIMEVLANQGVNVETSASP